MTAIVRVLTLLHAYRWRAALAILLGCVTIASNIGLLATAAYLIAAAALKPLLVALAVPLYLVRVLGVSRAFSRYAERLVAHNATLTLLAEVRAWFYGRLEPLAPARLLEYRSGDLLARIVQDVDELQNVFVRAFSPAVVALVTSLLACGLLYRFSPALGFAVAGFLLVAGVGVPLLAGALARETGRQQVGLRAQLSAHIVDGIQGLQDVLACAHASQHRQSISLLNRAIARREKRIGVIAGLQRTLNDLAMNLAAWLVLIVAIPFVTHRGSGGVYLALLVLVALSSFEAVQPLGQAFQFLGRSIAAGDRLFEVIDAGPRVVDPLSPRSPASVGVAGVPAPLCASGDLSSVGRHAQASPALEFDRVSFAYRADEDLVLDQISFRVDPGRWVAVVGPSGAGKSTLAHLALRFWDPDGGEIRLGGHDIRDFGLDDLRSRIGVVAQETHIFADTVRNNLLLARPDATEAELARALEQAQAAELVDSLPHGLDTWVGEQGLRLSGGERQRLAIARALLKNAPILLLDEATANLDPITEQALLAALHELMRGRSVLTIGHRLVAMERMDEILVLDRGRVVERGTHEQLGAAHGPYRQMLDVQNQMLALP